MNFKSLLVSSLFSLFLQLPAFGQITPLDIYWEITEEQLLMGGDLKKPEKTVREQYHKDLGLIRTIEIKGKTEFLGAKYEVLYTFLPVADNYNILRSVRFFRVLDAFSAGSSRILNYFGNQKIFYLDEEEEYSDQFILTYYSKKNKYELHLSRDYITNVGSYFDSITLYVYPR